jgi:phage tail P2-like protein
MVDIRLIPPPLRDASGLAINELADRVGSLDITPLLVRLIDDVPAALLPYLAAEFHIVGWEGWLLAESESQQRQVIKESAYLHRVKGTPYAIERIFTILGLDGALQEWWQYDGLPYHFRLNITTSDGRQIMNNQLAALMTMVMAFKNIRSQLDAISIIAVQPAAHIYIAAGNVLGITITTQPHP